MSIRQKFVLAHALLLAACGPGLVGVDHDDGTSSAETTGAPPSTSDVSTSDDTSTPDDTSTSSADTGLEFVAVPDVNTSVVACEPLAQGCPHGEKCVPYASTGGSLDAHRCVPVLGDQATGEPCRSGGVIEATDDCDANSFCWNVMEIDGEAIGTCHAFCMGTLDEPSCPEGSVCPVSADSSLGLCIPTCDPLAQDCGEGLGCYWGNQGFVCVVRIDDLPIGAPCGFINDCAPGSFCVDASALPDCVGAACCTSYCNIELGPEQCDALPGTACVSFFEQGLAPLEYELVGVCIVP